MTKYDTIKNVYVIRLGDEVYPESDVHSRGEGVLGTPTPPVYAYNMTAFQTKADAINWMKTHHEILLSPRSNPQTPPEEIEWFENNAHIDEIDFVNREITTVWTFKRHNGGAR